VLGRTEHAHAGHRVVARQDHDLDLLLGRAVEGEQLVDERERDTGLGRAVEAFELELHVGAVVVRLEMLVLFLEVEQRARRDRDDELAVQGCGIGG
jgi:hypothetical protein